MNARVFFEYAYLAIAFYCAYQVYALYNTPDRTQWYIYIAFTLGALAMFWFRRNTRLKNRRR
ncbi:hypothetical protein [Capnocytophaga sputigena]|uniref:hypothetical protein n=1 Tax=Capnocytophaga sputigena TaxID=1019 RepID=UPI0028ED121E|nr:hypothetical protein [Capnocytophaga sputigena]